MATAARRAAGGRLLVIGGNEDPDEDRMRILPHFVEMAGGARSRILVCSAPAEKPEKKARTYRKLFEKLGASEVREAAVARRDEAEDPELVRAAERATAVFITGGDQLRLTAVVAGTRLDDVVRKRLFGGGLVVGGTSAGAAAMSGTMLIGGEEHGTVRRSAVSLAPGLGYWPDTVVDTHFDERGRVHRLLTIFAHNPQVLGVGIDGNTALDLTPGKRFEVIGARAVMVFDGRVTHSDAPERADHETISLTDATVHVLAEGYGFDLSRMRPLRPDGAEIPARPAED